MKKYLHQLISEDQTGFMKNRNIATNIRKVIDIDEYCYQNDIDAIVLSVDFEKCFDSVEISSLPGILKYFNFGDNFSGWVMTLFRNMMICTMNNGYTSDYFTPTRGLFQGNPIASFLYLLAGQVLNDQIANNPRIKGIQFENKQIKSIQFADDLNMPLMFEQETLSEAFHEIQLFKQQVGLRINLQKLLIYRIGAIRDNTCILNSHGIPWENKCLKILGIEVTKDKTEMEKQNIEPLIVKMEAIANSWTSRGLSLVGKVLIINTLLMSLLVYRVAVLPSLTGEYVRKINKVWSAFLWSGKRPKIAWSILIAPKRHGGMGLSDVVKRDLSLKVQWVSYYFRDSVVRFLADNLLQNKVGELLWKCNFNQDDCKQITKATGFWYDVLVAWAKFNYHNPTGEQEVLEQVLWYNSHIKIAQKICYNLAMICSGILTIKDLLTSTGKLLKPGEFSVRYPAVNILEYISIVHAIPETWKNYIRNSTDSVSNYQTGYQILNKELSLVSIAYQAFHTNIYLLEHKRNKWERMLNIQVWPDFLLKCVQRLWKITNNGKLRSFQYRIFNHAIVTNVQLKYWRIKQTDLCTFCNSSKETILHLLYRCNRVIPLWNIVRDWCNRIEPGNVTFTDETIIFNTVSKNPNSVVNILVLITKYYIYRTRCIDGNLNALQLKEFVLFHNKMEYMGACAKNKAQKSKDKWEFALNVIKY